MNPRIVYAVNQYGYHSGIAKLGKPLQLEKQSEYLT